MIKFLNIQLFKDFIIERLQIANNLPFNVTASNDGWLNRSSKLIEEMNDKIIPSLCKKGWQCYLFAEPIKKGGYITIKASKNSREIKVALLYSSATNNETYKELVG